MTKQTITWFLIFFTFSTQAQKAPMHALLIGIGQYQNAHYRDRPTTGTTDVAIWGSLLEERGFPSQNITKLENVNATRIGILQSLRQLLNRVKPGDLVFLLHSGHGTQVPDYNQDETEDQLDEAIVPFDAIYRDDHSLIIDDTINVYLKKIANKLGPQGHLMAVFDACHSGTLSKDLANADITALLPKMQGFLSAHPTSDLPKNTVAIYATQPNEKESGVRIPKYILEDLNLSKQDSTCGKLTLNLLRILQTSGALIPYQQVIEQLKRYSYSLASQPFCEGDANLYVFGGRLNPPHDRYFVAFKNGKWVLNAGFLDGIKQGTTLGLLSTESKDTIIAEVNQVYLHKAELLTPSTLKDMPRRPLPAIVLEHPGLEIAPIRIKIQLPHLSNLRNELFQKLKIYKRFELDTLSTSKSAADVLIYTNHNVLFAKTIEGKNLAPNVTYSENWTEVLIKLTENLRTYAQSKALFTLCELENAQVNGINIDFKVEKSKAPINHTVCKDETLSFSINYQLETPAYYSIIQIDTSDLLRLVIPSLKTSYYDDPMNRKLKKGKPQTFTMASESLQEEQFVVIITPEPIDFKSIIIPFQKNAINSLKKPTPLEQAFGEAISNLEFRGTSSNVLNQKMIIWSKRYRVINCSTK